MRFTYIAPSALPSRAANAVHVVLQCDALARAGADLTLYARRTMRDERMLSPAIADAYGVDPSRWEVVSYHSRVERGGTVRTAAVAVRHISGRVRPDALLSRNLYAAFFLAVLQRLPLLFESHGLESGFRLWMQRAIMSCPWVTTIVISDALADYLTTHHRLPRDRTRVLRDAAPRGISPIKPEARRETITELVPEARGDWVARCAYFGHLYPGRGVEIIEAMADARPQVAFLVFGGTESDLASRRETNTRANLYFLGHRPHTFALRAMVAADVLLMPYQTRVSIGLRSYDTARWMSPMKMFEYLASGVPIIASDLPVLREVLKHEHNALLVAPDRPELWLGALDLLLSDPARAGRLGANGHADYLAHHTWDKRATELMAIAATTRRN